MAQRKTSMTEDSRCLTPRQIEILTMIRDGRRRNGFSSTLQEIADELGISKITVFEHVEAAAGNPDAVLDHEPDQLRAVDQPDRGKPFLSASVRAPGPNEEVAMIIARSLAAEAPRTF